MAKYITDNNSVETFIDEVGSITLLAPQLNYTNIDTLIKEWVTPNFWSAVGQIFTGKITDLILSFRAYPFKISPSGYVNSNIKYNNGLITSKALGSKVYRKLITSLVSSYFNERHFNDFRDFNGYTEINAYLPYYGDVSLDVNEFIDKYILFYLVVDLLNGTAVWYICSCSQDEFDDNSKHRIVAQYSCTVGVDIPYATSNAVDRTRNIIMGVVNTAVAVATTKMPSTTKTVSTVTKEPIIGRSKAKGSKMKVLQTGGGETKTSVTKNYGNPTSALLDSTTQTLNSLRVQVGVDKNIGSMLSLSNPQNIHIKKYYPKYLTDNNTVDFRKFNGRPYGIVTYLSDITGYTEVSAFHLEGEGFATATASELNEIHSLLLSGIIL